MTSWKPTNCGPWTTQLNTPLNTVTPHKDPVDETVQVEVVDPYHPLYGRRFLLHSMSSPINSPPHAYVFYDDQVTLRLPLNSTNLGIGSWRPRSKLTLQSIQALIETVQDCEELCAIIFPKPSGVSCPRPNATPSKPN